MVETTNSNSSVLVITNTTIYQTSSKMFLRELGYEVIGPFDSVLTARAYIKHNTPNIILFDTKTTESEIIEFDEMMLNEAKGIPLILLIENTDIDVDYFPVEFLNPPLEPASLKGRIDKLYEKSAASNLKPVEKVLQFMNSLFDKIIKLVPQNYRQDVEHHIVKEITHFTENNENFVTTSKGDMTIKLFNPKYNNAEHLADQISIMLRNLIDTLNEQHESTWARSLIEDAIETTVLNTTELPEPVVRMIESYNIEYNKILSSLANAVPTVETTDKTVLVAKVVLTDIGPELRDMVSDDPTLLEEIDPSVATHLITIVGQGSSYHQGIFGPLPIPYSNKIIAIMQSKLLASNIMDSRMEGRTLVVVAICMKRELINMIPKRDDLLEVFSPLDNLTHEEEITTRLLQQIQDNYEMIIQTNS